MMNAAVKFFLPSFKTMQFGSFEEIMVIIPFNKINYFLQMN